MACDVGCIRSWPVVLKVSAHSFPVNSILATHSNLRVHALLQPDLALHLGGVGTGPGYRYPRRTGTCPTWDKLRYCGLSRVHGILTIALPADVNGIARIGVRTRLGLVCDNVSRQKGRCGDACV